ncbi:hypothetical protein [Corynebacterium guangdongense]|uniref:Uncharacterized protein n=1 Tax=Corynebacterium guangdongense TaxID=1783348 RepID=A0ABU1ZWJ8_9CORY|nr:hypothetical protein [Corynebacterium guangdongense]MDR7329296.1 hypothetical protein [Corynebacterium guangdongense]WJZ17862.1 hypothetical protein CGUA_06455 [Corynebacterium guangdongense]
MTFDTFMQYAEPAFVEEIVRIAVWASAGLLSSLSAAGSAAPLLEAVLQSAVVN